MSPSQLVETQSEVHGPTTKMTQISQRKPARTGRDSQGQ